MCMCMHVVEFYLELQNGISVWTSINDVEVEQNSFCMVGRPSSYLTILLVLIIHYYLQILLLIIY